MKCFKCLETLNSIKDQDDQITAYQNEWRRINNHDYCGKCIDKHFEDAISRTHEEEFRDGPSLYDLI